MAQQNVAQSASTSLQSSAVNTLRTSQSGSLATHLQTQAHRQNPGNQRLSSALPTQNPLASPQVMPLEAAFTAATQPHQTTLAQSLQNRAPGWLKQGLQGMQQWLGTGRLESGVSPLPQTQGPLIGIIDTGFAPGQHGHQMLQTIQSGNPGATILLADSVGKGTWADSLTKFVDTAKASGQTKAVVNASFDLTQKNPDGSITTRQELTAQEKAALNYARENGVLVVASAGNEAGAMSALGQASGLSDNLIVVGSAEGNDRAAYSSSGKGLDFLFADSPDSNAGTSASAAKTTQTIAKIWAANPNLTPQQVVQTLEATAIDLKKPGWDTGSGLGIVNPEAALHYAATVAPPSEWMAQMGFTQPASNLSTPTWNGNGGAIATERANGWPSLRSIGHGILDAAGFIPVVGAAADVANAAWYAAEGDYVNAGLSAAAAIPGIGDAAAAARLGVRGVRAATSSARTARAARTAPPQAPPTPRPSPARSGSPPRRPAPSARPRPSGSGAAPRRPRPGGIAGRGRTTTAAPSPRRTPQRSSGQGAQPRRPDLSPARQPARPRPASATGRGRTTTAALSSRRAPQRLSGQGARPRRPDLNPSGRPARTPQVRANPRRTTPQSPSLRAGQPRHQAGPSPTRPQLRAAQGRANPRRPAAPITSRRPTPAGRPGQRRPQQPTARTPEQNSRIMDTQDLAMEAASYPLQEMQMAIGESPLNSQMQAVLAGAGLPAMGGGRRRSPAIGPIRLSTGARGPASPNPRPPTGGSGSPQQSAGPPRNCQIPGQLCSTPNEPRYPLRPSDHPFTNGQTPYLSGIYQARTSTGTRRPVHITSILNRGDEQALAARASRKQRTYLVYTLRDASGAVQYVGKASGRGSAHRVLKGRIRRGHDHIKNDSSLVEARIEAFQDSDAANKAAEEIFYSYFQSSSPNPSGLPAGANANGRPLNNRTRITGNNPDANGNYPTIEAFVNELRGGNSNP